VTLGTDFLYFGQRAINAGFFIVGLLRSNSGYFAAYKPWTNFNYKHIPYSNPYGTILSIAYLLKNRQMW
jgi:hypothetical protein